MNESIQDLMRAATRLTQGGDLRQATEAIQRALGQAGLSPAAASVFSGAGLHPEPAQAPAPADDREVLDGCVFEVGERGTGAAAAAGAGTFTDGKHSHAGRTLRYKLYTPPGAGHRPLPLVVMLHGCTQDPDDFARGTAMNALAAEQGFFVLYPAQAQEANPSRCWNWFKHNHQQRGAGEPAVIASLAQAMVQSLPIDKRRVYVAGLSAGGAMAAIVAAAYPEIFAAAGVHSGLPQGAARDMPGALAVMRTGQSGPAAAAGGMPIHTRVPTIVFHGDQDHTVHPRNGEQVVVAALGGANARARGERVDASPTPAPHVTQGQSPQGQKYTRSSYGDLNGEPLVEHWLLHGAGHAWSGGSPQGSYTDIRGPDASREMLRFFMAHPHG